MGREGAKLYELTGSMSGAVTGSCYAWQSLYAKTSPILQRHIASLTSLLALATLGDATQIVMFLSVSLHLKVSKLSKESDIALQYPWRFRVKLRQ
jgi:hypothetical protein